MERYLAAIARRNTAWARMQEAREWLEATSPFALDVQARRRELNEARREYEHACRDLIRERVLLRSGAAA